MSELQQPQEGQPTAPAAEPAPPATPAAQAATPPWGSESEFNPERAWKLIQDLKEDKEKLSKREVLTPEQKQQLAEYEQWQLESKTELERATADLTKWQTEAESWRSAALSSRVQALAVDFADPSDAVNELSSRNYIDAGGQINDAAIQHDLNELLTRKPHWRKPEPAPPAGPRTPAPNRNQGSGSGTPAGDPRQEFAAILQAGLNRTQ